MGAGGPGSWDIAAINREGMKRLGASGASLPSPPPREGELEGSPWSHQCLRGISEPAICLPLMGSAFSWADTV